MSRKSKKTTTVATRIMPDATPAKRDVPAARIGMRVSLITDFGDAGTIVAVSSSHAIIQPDTPLTMRAAAPFEQLAIPWEHVELLGAEPDTSALTDSELEPTAPAVFDARPNDDRGWPADCMDDLITDPAFYALLNVVGDMVPELHMNEGYAFAVNAALFHLTTMDANEIDEIIKKWICASCVCAEMGKKRQAGFSPAVTARAKASIDHRRDLNAASTTTSAAPDDDQPADRPSSVPNDTLCGEA